MTSVAMIALWSAACWICGWISALKAVERGVVDMRDAKSTKNMEQT